jgi:glycosyltransferase involved in cell wall biosynthesis
MAGNLASSQGCGLLSYSYYGYAAFQSFGVNRWPKVLMQVHPHPTSVRKILYSELECSEFGTDSLLGEQELSSDQNRFEMLATEAHLADHCIVASNFTKLTLIENGVPEQRIHRVPYGVDISAHKVRDERNSTFRVVFVGQMVQRKGLEYLLKAWSKLQLPNAELVLAGRGRVDTKLLAAFQSNFVYMSDLSDRKLEELYDCSDVFCMPSLVEGFGLVYLEALACGLPVIATPNTGAADIVREGREGFIVPIRDVEALAEKLEWAYQNRSALAEMRIAARTLAAQYSWARFRQGIKMAIEEVENMSLSC